MTEAYSSRQLSLNYLGHSRLLAHAFHFMAKTPDFQHIR